MIMVHCIMNITTKSSLVLMFFSLFSVLCRSGPVSTALCSCHLSHHGLQGSQQWCWPTIALRVFSGSSQKSPRCQAWQNCWWYGITRIRVLLRVSVPVSHNNENAVKLSRTHSYRNTLQQVFKVKNAVQYKCPMLNCGDYGWGFGWYTVE